MNKLNICQADFISRCEGIAHIIFQKFQDSCKFSEVNIYGVPKGGIPVAYQVVNFLNLYFNAHEMNCVASVTFVLQHAQIVVDDLVDSGKTREKYQDFVDDGDFYALIDKKEDGLLGTWVTFPWETEEKSDNSALDIPLRFLQYIGENPSREGLLDTPKRVVKSWDFLFSGYSANVKELFRKFENPGCDEMVILDNIEFYSTCEHHLLPFYGKCHVGYIPDKKVIGVSKIARLVDVFSRRLQIQENLTKQIADTLQEELQPIGVGVITIAQHFCMTSRGVQKQNSLMKTSSITGAFRKPEVRAEFLKLISLR